MEQLAPSLALIKRLEARNAGVLVFRFQFDELWSSGPISPGVLPPACQRALSAVARGPFPVQRFLATSAPILPDAPCARLEFGHISNDLKAM